MSLYTDRAIASMLDRWHDADAMDFGILAISIIVIAWFVSKYYGD
jgi:hypothetical protein